MPFRYLVSGGVSMRPLMPEVLFPVWRALESCFAGRCAMFGLVHLVRR
jgi:hypothetical protein